MGNDFATVFFLVAIISLMLGFVVFVIYFLFKILQFVIQAINLYKKILSREEVIIKVLLDIRDNTKNAHISTDQFGSEDSDQDRLKCCPICNKNDIYRDANGDFYCPNCKQIIDQKLVITPQNKSDEYQEDVRKIDEHEEEFDEALYEYTCEKCNVSFQSDKLISYCEACGSELKIDEDEHEIKIKYRCHHCDVLFNSADDLKFCSLCGSKLEKEHAML